MPNGVWRTNCVAKASATAAHVGPFFAVDESAKRGDSVRRSFDRGWSLNELLSRRVVLITGKGGVGRSTTAAAIATLGQRAGRRTLLCEIGEAASDYSPLARHFGRERLPTTPEQLAPGIQGVLLLARTGQELFLRSVIRSATVARLALNSDALRRLLQAGPSFKEMGVYFQLLTALRARRADGALEHEFIVVDMPATGHTLSLTGLPELLLRLVPRGPIADALREGQAYLNDPKQSAAYVVTIPEALPVTECLELLAGLRATSMHTAGVVMNRVPADPFSPKEREALTAALRRSPTLGLDGFQRPTRATAEIARLTAATSVPVRLVPELTTGRLVDAVADALSAGAPT